MTTDYKGQGKLVGPIEVGELKIVSLDVGADMDPTATIASMVMTCKVVEGVDANPLNVLVGSPSFVGTVVYQRVQPGVVGTIYKIRVLVTDSLGLKHGAKCFLGVTKD